MSKDKKESITLYLTKENVKLDDCFDKDKVNLKPHDWFQLSDLPSGFNSKGLISLSDSRNPPWFDLVVNSSPSLKNKEEYVQQLKSLSALVAVSIKGSTRKLVFCFGYARQFLNWENIELHFGRNIVLNLVDPEKVISMTKMSHHGLPWVSQNQAAAFTDLYNYELDASSEILQNITALIQDKDIIKDGSGTPLISPKLTGLESLKLSGYFDFKKINVFSNWILKNYTKKRYKTVIPGIDSISIVKNKADKDELFSKLIKKITSDTLDVGWLMPPDVTSFQNIDGFLIDDVFDDPSSPLQILDFDEWKNKLKELSKLGSITLNYIKTKKIDLIYNGARITSWPIYRCLHVEMKDGHDTFLLMSGSWFKVKNTYIEEVETFFNHRSKIGEYPKWSFQNHNDERGYNLKMAEKRNIDFHDGKIVSARRGQGVEPCDLLENEKNFIHVKRLKSSAGLSHLIQQSVVSTELFILDDSYRDKFLNGIQNKAKAARIRKTLIERKQSVTLAIILENRKTLDKNDLSKNVPIFTLIGLKWCVESIEKLLAGQNVKIQLIEVKDRKPKTIKKKR